MKRPVTPVRWLERAAHRFGAVCTSIGKRLASPAAVPVSAVILSRLSTVSPEQSLDEVATLLVGEQLATVAVVDHGTPIGLVTRDALAGSLATDGAHMPIGLVPLGEVIVVGASDSIEHVLQKLHAAPGAVALMLDNGRPVGMVTERQLDEYLEQRDAA